MNKKELSSYEKQALDFLSKYSIDFECRRRHSKPSEVKGMEKRFVREYEITLRKANGEIIIFPFTGSINDFEKGIDPSAYDVLSCCSCEIDLAMADTFEDFCAMFGYSEDSRKALDIYLVCRKHSKLLRGFFNTEEMRRDLGEIL